MTPLDPLDPKTWVNHDPPVPDAIQAELTRLGGLVPNAAFGDQPVFKLVFGQQHKEFIGGRKRIFFRDTRIPKLFKVSRFFVAPEAFVALTTWAKDNPKIDEFGCFVESRQPLSERIKEEFSGSYQQLETMTLSERDYRSQGHAPKIAAPQDWLFVSEVEDVISIGRQCWYVMRWLPAGHIEKPGSWNANRFEYDVFLPEAGTVPVLDLNGAYPENGAYTALFEIAEYQMTLDYSVNPPAEKFDYRNYRYRQPSRSNAVLPVIEELASQTGELTEDEKAQRELADHIKNAESFMKEIDAQEENWDQFVNDTRPMFAGEARVYQPGVESPAYAKKDAA